MNARGSQARVLDVRGNALSPCTKERAQKLVEAGRAQVVSEDPLIIRLTRAVDIPPAPAPAVAAHHAGERVLLHICCAPCATYTVERLREIGFDVTGYWYNPNIHPWGEHERRRESLVRFAGLVDLPMVWAAGYDMPLFLRRVGGREEFRRRCAVCYAMRLSRTAQEARAGGFDAFTTTLLISPYQDQALLRRIGERLAEDVGVRFYFENFRRGWAERGRLTRLYGLYRQGYCGCLYSEWERYNSEAIEAILPAEGDIPQGPAMDLILDWIHENP